MDARRLGGHAAGKKTDWVIEFPQGSALPEGSKLRPNILFFVPARPVASGSGKNVWLDTQGIQKVQQDYSNFLKSITKLCSLLEKEGMERSEDLKKIGQDSQAMDSALQNLGEIIKKFNEMLKKLKNEGEEGAKE